MLTDVSTPSSNSLEANRRIWNDEYHWSEDGDEWQGQAHVCGLSYEKWKSAVVERLIDPSVHLGMNIVEIAPGHGRWTEFPVPHAGRLVLVDISPNCLAHCRKRFGERENLETHLSDGLKRWRGR